MSTNLVYSKPRRLYDICVLILPALPSKYKTSVKLSPGSFVDIPILNDSGNLTEGRSLLSFVDFINVEVSEKADLTV